MRILFSPEIAGFSAHQNEHIIPLKHGGETNAENMALACVLCNRRKSSDLAAIDPETNEIIRLFHPRRDAWNEHFRLAPNGQIVPLTPLGRATASLLQFNEPERLLERQQFSEDNLF